MKKWICALLALLMLCTMASAESAEPVCLNFEDGFSLSLPAGWLYYEPSGEMRQQNVLYCLSDAAGEGWLYVQRWESDCADADALLTMVNEEAKPISSGKYPFNGFDFVVYDLEQADVSCCATLMNGSIFNFVFTPQSSPDFMVVAAQIIGTFTMT